ncbi:MAG: hypothetical protein K9J46_23150, partial [Saprospiraceae bacterium]|nr:hypothetical protein [Saprospiraceae bacterium]
MPLHLLGIRHHGPGSAKAVLSALEANPPDCLLVEAPADGIADFGLRIADSMPPNPQSAIRN